MIANERASSKTTKSKFLALYSLPLKSYEANIGKDSNGLFESENFFSLNSVR
jgi:hypothetical protein